MDKKKICIIGLGYIGLPTAAMFATHGHKIIGVDINRPVVEALNNGKITINEPYLDIMVQASVTSGNLVAYTEPKEADVFIIAVPTPITNDKKADMTYVVNATKAITPLLRKGNIVILESTSPTGTVKNILLPILKESGLNIGEDVFVAHSPERVLPGRILIELVENNRIVGGINQQSGEAVKELYRTFVKGEIYVTDATTAEMCKMMENTYRDVNIALANELAMICEREEINVWDVVSLCNKHPRVNIHQPGPGVGGHCIAVDPWFIVERYPEMANIIHLSRSTNDAMPEFVAEKVNRLLDRVNGNKVITIFGITYKPDVDDIRESPILHLIEILEGRSDIEIRVVDPLVQHHRYLVKDTEQALTGSDLVLIGVNHKEFASFDFEKAARTMRNKTILDTRNLLSGKTAMMKQLDIEYHLLGAGN